MKKFLKNEGFTLVELIVVIAILGILAAVAVPAYSGYITKANESADITALDAVKTAAFAAVATEGAPTKVEVESAADDGVITEVVATVAGTAKTLYTSATGDTDNADFVTFMGTTMPELKSATYEKGAEWADNTWTGKDLG